MIQNLHYLNCADRLRSTLLLLSVKGYKVKKVIIDDNGCRLLAAYGDGYVELDWDVSNENHKKIKINGVSIVIEK